MLEFQPPMRAYLSEIRALSKDQDNNDVFIGMTVTESTWYADYLEASFQGTVARSDDAEAKYLALHDKHEEARRTVLAGESLMRSFGAATQ